MSATYRLVVLGNSGVGKTAAIKRFKGGNFSINYVPTVEDNHTVDTQIGEENVSLTILDTSGGDALNAVNRQMYFKHGEGFILVYDVTKKDSFLNIKNIYEEIRKTRKMDESDRLPMILVGNKNDLVTRREVQIGDGEILANEYNCPFFEMSAKENNNISDVFHTIVSEIREQSRQVNPKLEISTKKCKIL